MLRFTSTNVCERCGRHVKEGRTLCDECSSGAIGIDFSRSCLYYDDVTSSIIKKFKYSNRRDIGRFISSIMHEKMLTEAEYADIDCIAYIPFSYFKRYNRFYNHSRFLAENLSEMTGIPVVHGIISQRLVSFPQAKLPSTLRMKRPSMFKRGERKITAGKVLLIDDVITTGRTLSDASDAILIHNKVKRVVSLTFAC